MTDIRENKVVLYWNPETETEGAFRSRVAAYIIAAKRARRRALEEEIEELTDRLEEESTSVVSADGHVSESHWDERARRWRAYWERSYDIHAGE